MAHAYNSKRYYVIINGNDVNEQITSYPLTDSKTVMDAIASVGGLEEIANKGRFKLLANKRRSGGNTSRGLARHHTERRDDNELSTSSR